MCHRENRDVFMPWPLFGITAVRTQKQKAAHVSALAPRSQRDSMVLYAAGAGSKNYGRLGSGGSYDR